MKRFDFSLMREKKHYVDLIDNHIKNTGIDTVFSTFSKWNAEGLFFEKRSNSIRGMYIEQFPLLKNGQFHITFIGHFKEDNSGSLHFVGWLFPSFLHIALYILALIFILVFATDFIFAWIIFSSGFAFFAFISAKLTIEGYRKLKDFFEHEEYDTVHYQN